MNEALREIIGNIAKNPLPELPDYLSDCKGVKGFASPSILAVIYYTLKQSKDDAIYCEMGVFCGLSATAANAGRSDTQRLLLIDNFSEYDGIAKQEKSLELLSKTPGVEFINQDCFLFMRSHMTEPWDIFYYDAGHTFEATYTALGIARHNLKPGAIVFIDDTNMGQVRAAVNNAAADFGYTIQFDFPSRKNGSPDWWNGFMILEKT